MSVCLYVCLSLRLSVCVSHQPIYLLSFMTLPLSFRFFLFWQFSLIFSKVVYFSIIYFSPSLDGEEEDKKSLASDFQLQHSTFFSLHFSPSSQRFVFSQFFLVSFFIDVTSCQLYYFVVVLKKEVSLFYKSPRHILIVFSVFWSVNDFFFFFSRRGTEVEINDSCLRMNDAGRRRFNRFLKMDSTSKD